MEEEVTDRAFTLSAGITLALALIPFTAVTLFLPPVAGAWIFMRSLPYPQERSLIKKAIRSAILATFTGMMLAALIFDMVWTTFDYQIGKDLDDFIALKVFEMIGGDNGRQLMEAHLQAGANAGVTIGLIIGQVIGGAVLCSVLGGATSAAYAFWRTRLPK
jgi:hypothetical protein